MTRRRIAAAIGGLIVAWFVFLFVLGIAKSESYGQGVADRMSESLKASGTLEDSDLALIRGRLALDGMRVERDDEVGKLTLDVAAVRCELAPVGLALVDSDCRVLAIDGLRLDASTPDLFKVKRPKRTPIHARAMTIDDATFAIGTPLGRAEVALDYVRAGETMFRTPASWLFSLYALHATVTMPFTKLDIVVRDGLLIVRGNVALKQIHSTVAYAPPAQNTEDSGEAELARVVGFVREIADAITGKSR